MLGRIVEYVTQKPRTSALVALVGVPVGAFLAWNVGSGIGLLGYMPLLLCLVMHGIMHRGHARHGNPGETGGDAPALQKIPVDRAGTGPRRS